MKQPKRLKNNRNHVLHYNSEYMPTEGVVVPVMTAKGPLVLDYLDRAYQVFDNALKAHSKVLAVRFDLKLPQGIPLPDDAQTNRVMRRFLGSLQSKIDANLKRKGSPHKCLVRHIVAREIGHKNQNLHFHVMLLLNGHAFRHIGSIDCEDNNLFWLIVEAWASALKVTLEEAIDGVQVGFKRGVAHYYLDPIEDYRKLPDAFHRVSYLCKAATKQYGDRHHGLMTSRR